MTGPVLLEACGVTKSFGGVRALAGVDWTVRAGEIWGVVGPNGSGKTTFFNCLSGFHRLTAGSVQFDGADVSRHPMRARARAGLVRTFQHAEVFGSLTVADNLVVAARATRRSRPELVASLDEVGLGPLADVPASALSFGRRRLLGVAMAAAMGPSLLLLDEPTSGLNDAESEELRAFLLLLNAGGLTIAVVDHHMDFLLPLCQRMLLLRSGERLWEGPPDAFSRSEEVLSSYLGTAVS